MRGISPDRRQTLEVIGTEKFEEFVRELEQEGVGIETVGEPPPLPRELNRAAYAWLVAFAFFVAVWLSIFLSDSPEDIAAKCAKMITDPQRARRSDPGNPDVCNVFEFHKLYSAPETVADIDPKCRSAQTGCVECKKTMADNLTKALEPIREKRRYYEARPELVEDILTAGSEKAREVACETMEAVRSALKF